MTTVTGENCNLMHYVRDEFPQDILATLWKMMVDDGDVDKALWPFEKHDLVQFVQYISDPDQILFIVYNKDFTDCVGLTWFNTVVPDFKAHTAIYIRKKYRKILTDEVSKTSIDFMFNKFNLQELWSHTPWENAYKLSLRLGFVDAAILPNYVRIKGVLTNYYITRLKRG